MKMIKRRENSMKAANDERHQVLNRHVIWDGIIDGFKGFRNDVKGNYGQMDEGYLFDT
jgi:hypothetical protein